MAANHPKSVRRRLLLTLYERYLQNPLEMLGPDDFLSNGFERDELLANIHYLSDSKLVELMMGYSPPWFVATRITAAGIDLVENRFDFDLRFPPAPNEDASADGAEILYLIERLTEEADFSPLDGDARAALLRDVQFLRTELSRPETRWRNEVIDTVVGWIENSVEDAAENLPSLAPLRTNIEAIRKNG